MGVLQPDGRGRRLFWRDAIALERSLAVRMKTSALPFDHIFRENLVEINLTFYRSLADAIRICPTKQPTAEREINDGLTAAGLTARFTERVEIDEFQPHSIRVQLP